MPDVAAVVHVLADHHVPLAGHVLVDSQGPAAGPGCGRLLADAATLAGAARPVTVVLVDGAVAAGVAGTEPAVTAALGAGARVVVDGFALARRGIPAAALADGVTVADADAIAALLLVDGVQVVWR